MMVYEALDQGQWAVWVTQDDGTSAVRIPCSAHDCRYPSWGSDSLAVFYVARNEHTSEIRMNILGKTERSVSLIAGDVRGLSVSPGGDYVAFVYDEGGQWGMWGKGEWGLWAVPASGGTKIPIIRNMRLSASPDVKPKWSTDGKNVMSIGNFKYGYRRPDLAVVLFRPNRAEMGEPVFTAVAGDRGNVSSFSPSPAGDGLVYTVSFDWNTHLWVVLKAKPVSPYGS
jgi:Tol biopolymer transport system component